MEVKKDTRRNMKRGFSRVTFLIILLCISFVCLVVYLKFDAIEKAIIGKTGSSIEQKTSQNEKKLLLDEKLSLSGEIQETNDLLTYSHYLIDQKYGKVYLKSKNFNLFEYAGSYNIEGVVDEFYDSYPVLEVESLKENKTKEKSVEKENEKNENKNLSGAVATGNEEKVEEVFYDFPAMGLWFDKAFTEKYSIQSQTNSEVVFVQSGVENASPFTISMFKCGNAGSSNCTSLLETFKESAEDTITNQITLNFYKLSEIKSWFFVSKGTDEKTINGYYINDADTETVQEVSNYLFVNNEWYVKNVLLENISNFCYDENVILQKYDTFKLYTDQGHSYVNIDYNAKDTGKVFCKLELQGAEVLTKEFKYSDYEEKSSDFSISSGVNISSGADTSSIISSEEDNKWTKEKDTVTDEKDINTDENFDITVEQFKLKPEKSLTFSSARGHKIVFPSPNIAYQEVSEKSDFNQKWVNCFSTVKVIKYADNEKILENPAVEVYECSIKGEFDDASSQLIHKVLEKDWKARDFVIKINNPSWYEFAKNIDIK